MTDKAVKAMCDNCDIGKEVDEMLIDLRELALEERDFKTLRQLRRVRRRPALKAKVEAKVMEASSASLIASGRVGEFGDGEFAKWLIEWFSEEGWQIILSFIKGLLVLI